MTHGAPRPSGVDGVFVASALLADPEVPMRDIAGHYERAVLDGDEVMARSCPVCLCYRNSPQVIGSTRLQGKLLRRPA